MVKGRRAKAPLVRRVENERKITSFFMTENVESELLTPHRISPRKHASTVSVLQQANNITKRSPHRIEMKTDPVVQQVKQNNKIGGKVTDYFTVRRSVRKTKKTVLEEKRKFIEKAVLSGLEDGLDVHNFPDKGRGVVATKNFQRGDFVVEYSGELISLEQAKIREETYSLDQNTGCYMYYFVFKNTQYCVDATIETGRLGRLVNHSRNGNLITKTLDIAGIPKLVLIAKDDIKVGDELTYDYGDRSKESLRYHPWLAS